VSSVKEDNRRSKVDGAQKADSSFVIAGGDSAVLLECGEEVFNQMPSCVQVLIIGPLVDPVGFRRDDNGHPGAFEHREHPLLGIIGFIGEQRLNVVDDSRQQNIRPVEVMGLPRGQMKPRWIPQRIAGGTDFGAHPAFGAAETFRFVVPPFAPAAC